MLNSELITGLEKLYTVLTALLKKHEEEYLTIEEAADFLKVSANHFYKKEFQKNFPYIKIDKNPEAEHCFKHHQICKKTAKKTEEVEHG